MKKALVWILVFALISVASVLGTIAYLTDDDYANNVMTIGDVNIALLEYERIDTETKDVDAKVQEFHDNKPLLPAVIEKGFDYTPGDTYVDWTQSAVDWKQDGENGYTSPIWDPAKINNEVDKMVFVKNTGDYSAFVRTYFAFEAGSFKTFDKFQKMIHLNLNADGDWEWEWLPFPAENADGDIYFIAKATYKKALAPDNFTDITLSQISLDYTATNDDVDAFGDTYEVCVNTQAIQSDGFTDPKTALDENFGRDIPFENLKLAAGIDLKTALHNLNGNKSTPITTKVTSVTFGLNKDHSDKVSGYEGTLTSDEQDVPVYTYYVPNATNSANYDVYVLADSAIYTPKISEGLFQGMTSLTTVDTTNMDVSRTENMVSMFNGCKALMSMDVSKWNTENVKSFGSMFCGCVALASIDVSNWKTGSVTDMSYMFAKCLALASLDVSKWDVSNVTTFSNFLGCAIDEDKNNRFDANDKYNDKLTSLDVSTWNTVSATDMSNMFLGCRKLASLDVSGFNTSSVTNMQGMFNCCNSLTNLTLANWNTGNVTDMSYMFRGCRAFTTMDIGGWDVKNVATLERFLCSDNTNIPMNLQNINLSAWETNSLKNANWMFQYCSNMITANLHGWNLSQATDMAAMFEFCKKMTSVDVGDWTFGNNIADLGLVFRHCQTLEVVDLSSWSTASATSMWYLFEYCYKLQTVYVGDGWNMDNVTQTANMFVGCYEIKGQNGTVYDSTKTAAEYAHVDGGPENPGYLTYKPAESTTPEQTNNQ